MSKSNHDILGEVIGKIHAVMDTGGYRNLVVIFPQSEYRGRLRDLYRQDVWGSDITLQERIGQLEPISRVITSKRVKDITVWSPHMSIRDDREVVGEECPICDDYGPIIKYQDYIEGTLCEYEESCDKCNLYHYQFAYGNTEKMIGFVDICYGWGESQYEVNNFYDEVTKSAIAETREMYHDEQVRDWFKWPIKQRGLDWKASLADRLEELRKYPLNQATLSNLVKQEVCQ
jgi:hypothetical protein